MNTIKRTTISMVLLGSIMLLSFYRGETGFSKYHQDDLDGIEKSFFSVNPPSGKTGAPFEGTCTDCHGGAANPAAGTVDFDVDGASGSYELGQTYSV